MTYVRVCCMWYWSHNGKISLYHVWSRHINRKTNLLKRIRQITFVFLNIWLYSTPISIFSLTLFSPESLISVISHLDPFPSFQVGAWQHQFSFTKLFQFLFSTSFCPLYLQLYIYLWVKESQFSLRVLPLVDQLHSGGWSHTLEYIATQTGLGWLF